MPHPERDSEERLLGKGNAVGVSPRNVQVQRDRVSAVVGHSQIFDLRVILKKRIVHVLEFAVAIEAEVDCPSVIRAKFKRTIGLHNQSYGPDLRVWIVGHGRVFFPPARSRIADHAPSCLRGRPRFLT